MGQEKLAALLLYGQLFKSLGNRLSRDQLRNYKYTIQARVQGENQQILKNLEIYLKAIKTQNLIMDAVNIGKPKDYKFQFHVVFKVQSQGSIDNFRMIRYQ